MNRKPRASRIAARILRPRSWLGLPAPPPPRSNPGQRSRRCLRPLFAMPSRLSSHPSLGPDTSSARNDLGLLVSPRFPVAWPILEREVRTAEERRAPEGAGPGPRPPSLRWAGVVAGLLGAGVALFADSVLHILAPAVPFTPVSVAQAVIRAAPGAVDAFFIDRLQHLARPTAVVGSVVGFVLLAGLLGAALPAARRRLGSAPFAAAVLALPVYGLALALYR